MKYVDVDRLKAEIKKLIRFEELNFAALGGGGQTFCINTLEWVLKKIDSLQQEPIKKDEDAEKLILRDIMEATVARINGGKVDKEKEENIMMEKITYLRNLGLNAGKNEQTREERNDTET